jgi:hypothetical protein
VLITETVTNTSACDRPIGWTQHARSARRSSRTA